MEQLRNAFRRFWGWVRAVSGDDAYERYLAHHRDQHPGSAPLTRGEFFRSEQERRWEKSNRCC
ncbi:MAG TPA: YbdD/YjiX family protein [Gammaproteobacteria bacterium]|nr:YbdD/YjiX family protein [Gammaproteobacteria bacterium]